MPPLKFTEVLAYSSEDPNHPVENLLKLDTYLKWKSKPNHNEKQEYAILKLEKLSTLRSIDIGNEHSAFIEVLVGREGTEYKVLLVASSFMTPLEARNSTTSNRVRMFGPDKLNKNIAEQKWDRIKITCTQPFNKTVQFGLTFIKVYGPESKESPQNEAKLGRFTIKEEDDDVDSISVGSFFARKHEPESPLTGAASIRAASKASLTTPEHRPSPKRHLDEPANAAEGGFYQLKKKVKDEASTPKAKGRDEPSPKPPPRAAAEPTTAARQETPPPPRPRPPPPSSAKSESTSSAKRKSRPFGALMRDVVFVMSGYQNPQRAKLRDSLIAMGARYKADWEQGCTHLICAFKNTPKYQVVKGKGKIVNAKWAEDSFRRKIRLPWKRYSLEKNRDDSESEEEIWATEICPKEVARDKKDPSEPASSPDPHRAESMSDSEDTDDEIERALRESKTEEEEQEGREAVKEEKEEENGKRRNGAPSGGEEEEGEEDYGADTDVDEEEEPPPVLKKKDTSQLPLPPLPGFLEGKTFLLYGSLDAGKRKSLARYVVAHRGSVANYMSEEVNFVVTEDSWDEHFDEALNENTSLQFVKPHWIWKCCSKGKIVPPQPFLIVPKEDAEN